MNRMACGIFAVLAVIHTWPLVLVLPTHAKDYNDSILNIWMLGAIAQQLATDPLHPLGINMFYPFESPLALLDPQLTNGVLAAPATWLSGNPVFGHNLLILASFVLCGWTMFLLVRELTGSAAAGLIAGCLYAFAPFRTERLSHSHMLAGFWLPLMLLWIHRYVADPRWGRLLAVVALFVALALSSWYFAAIGMVAALVVGIGSLAAQRRARIAVVRGLAGALLGFVVLLPFALPFARVKAWEGAANTGEFHQESQEQGLMDRVQPLVSAQLDISGRAKTSAEVQQYLGVGAGARLWVPLRRFGFVEGSYFPGALGLALALVGYASARSRAAGPGLTVGPGDAAAARWWVTIPRASLGVAALAMLPAAAILCAALGWPQTWPVLLTRRFSLVVATLVSIALWSLWRIRQRDADPSKRVMWTYVALMVAGVLLSFGPQVRAFRVDLGAGVYPTAVPPFGVLRVPARFGVLYTVGIAVLAGFGVVWLERRVPRRARVAAIAGALLIVNAEHVVAPLTFFAVPRVTAADTWLKHAPDGPVVVFPTHGNPWALLNSLLHRKPMVNGSGLVVPPPYVRLNARDDLSPSMIEHLRTYFHPRYVVLNPELYPSEWAPDVPRIIEDAGDDLRQVAQTGATRIFELQPGGRGPRLVRWYPPPLLRGKAGVALRGRLETGRQDVDVTVTVSMNDALLASWSDRTFVPDVTQFVPFTAALDGAATIEVAADYTIRPGTAGAPIGRTGVPSPADIAIAAGGDRTLITVNNRNWRGQKGYTVVTLGASHGTEVRNFNTSWYEADSHKLAEYITGLERGRIVVIASNYDVSRRLTDDAAAALGTLGFTEDLRGHFRRAHAGIGVKGSAPGTAVECVGPETTSCGVGLPASVRLNLAELRLY